MKIIVKRRVNNKRHSRILIQWELWEENNRSRTWIRREDKRERNKRARTKREEEEMKIIDKCKSLTMFLSSGVWFLSHSRHHTSFSLSLLLFFFFFLSFLSLSLLFWPFNKNYCSIFFVGKLSTKALINVDKVLICLKKSKCQICLSVKNNSIKYKTNKEIKW